MSQTQGRAVIQPLGVVYNTTMSRPDSALALSALYSTGTRSAIRVGSICVTGAGFGAAVMCDVIARFYQPRVGGSNTTFAVGFTADSAAPDPPMVKAVIERKKDSGELQYPRSITRVTDTSLPEALIRNGATLTTQGAVILSAPATSLARALALAGAKDIFKQRVKRLVLVETDALRKDPASLTKLLAEWPSPIYVIGADVGAALPFPGAKLDSLFSWTPAHPAVDAYKAYKPMPYDAPLHDLAAMYFAVTPDADFFVTSPAGMLTAGNDGTLKLAPAAGQAHRISVDPSKQQQALDAIVAMAATQPTASPIRGRGPGAA